MRYLTLDVDGTLSYALAPGQRARDEIEVPHARVLSSLRDQTIHVDSGESVFRTSSPSIRSNTIGASVLPSPLSPPLPHSYLTAAATPVLLWLADTDGSGTACRCVL